VTSDMNRMDYVPWVSIRLAAGHRRTKDGGIYSRVDLCMAATMTDGPGKLSLTSFKVVD